MAQANSQAKYLLAALLLLIPLQALAQEEEEIEKIIDFGIRLKLDVRAGKQLKYLQRKTLAMIFERQSTRTRVSFDVGMTLLGGHAIFLTGSELGIGKRESPKDVAQVLSRYADAIIYRTIDEKNLLELAENATIPVINGLDRFEHPCQILADLFTVRELKGDLFSRQPFNFRDEADRRKGNPPG
jgi:ornithine carbamoyltransferase